MSTPLLQNYLTASAGRRPEATAVLYNQQSLTYGLLEQRSNQLARLLKQAGCRRGDRIALMIPKSLPAIAGMFGSAKADCIYIPIDVTGAPQRVARILESCEPTAILAAGAGAGLVEKMLAAGSIAPGTRLGWLDFDSARLPDFRPDFLWSDVEAMPAGPVDYANSSSDIVHILFTSGSTGVPKGVMITHANVMHFVEWAIRYFGARPTDRVSGHPPLHFDLSTFDVYGTILAGAELHLVPPEMSLLPHKLAEFIRRSKLTQWFSVPSILNHMAKFDVVRQDDFPALERLLWCGEAFPVPALIYWMQRLPKLTFTNLYGPTEATIASSFYTMPGCPADEKEAVPIGMACEGEKLLVLDEQMNPAPAGQIGDLYIGGLGLSPGYWRDPEKTAGVFVPDPADASERIYKTGDLAYLGENGMVYMVGRADTQIKHRGYRIELGEIETAFHAVDGIEECAVVAVEVHGFEGLKICCGYVPRQGVELSPLALRQKVTDTLPHYMMPSQWMVFERLPLNTSGKIDRRQLKELFQQQEEQAAAAGR